MQGIGFTDGISGTELHSLTDALTQELAKINPPAVSLRYLTVHPEAIYLKSHPAEVLYQLRARMYRAVIGAIGANSSAEDIPAPGSSTRTSASPMSTRTARRNPSPTQAPPQ
jgi:hypothetical protein